MVFFRNLLVWLRLADRDDGLLSLTNIAMIVVITKMALSNAPSFTEMATFLGALLAVQAKKVIRDRREAQKAEKEAAPSGELEQKVRELQDRVGSLQLQMTIGKR